MKTQLSVVFGALVCIGATIGSSFAQTPGHFRGSACIISVNAGCAPQGVSVGNCMTARFTPPNFGPSGGPATRLSLFTDYYTQNVNEPTGTLVGAIFRNVTISQIGNSSSSYNATMRIASLTPAIPATAASLTVIADVNGLQAGCNARFRFQGQRIPVSGPLP
jgi:hypothetical protein